MDIFTLAATIGIDLDAYEAGINRARGLFSGLESLLERGLTLAIRTTWDFGKDVIKTGSAFDNQMAAVQAVLGKEEGTVENMMGLRERALEVAEDSIFTSEEVAKAYYYMGMAGWKAEKMSSGLPGVIALAAASGEDLAMVSDIVTDSLTAFGLSADRAQEYADILAQTATNSNTDVRRMGKTFQYMAPIAGQMGVSVEDAALSIGLMASSSIKSSMAGTAFRQILTRISTNAGATSKALGALDIMTDKLGVTVFDTEGNFRDWSDILEDTRKAWGDISLIDKLYYAKQIASLRGMPAWLTLMNASQEDWNKLSESLSNAQGAAQTMADTRLDSLSGDVVKLNAAFDVMKVAIYDDVKGPLREVVQDGTESIKRITDAINKDGLTGGIEQVGVEIENVSKKWSPALESLGKSLVPILTGIFTDIAPALAGAAVELGVALGEGIFKGIGEHLAHNMSQSDNPLIRSLSSALFGTEFDNREIDRSYADLPGEFTGIDEFNIPHFNIPDEYPIDLLLKPLSSDEVQEAVNAGGTPVIEVGTEVEGLSDDIVEEIEPGAITGELSSAIESGITEGGSAGATSMGNSIAQAAEEAAASIGSAVQGALNATTLPDYIANVHVVFRGGAMGMDRLEFNAGAMNAGHIFNRPTMFGFANGKFQIAGDAGPEAVVGVNSLDSMIQSSVQSAITSVLSKMDAIISGQGQGDLKVVLDTGAVVGGLVREMDKQMGGLGRWRGGGRA